MVETNYRGRGAVSLENGRLRVTVMREGGHLAEICDLESGINPLWSPPWTSVEPSTVAAGAAEYGGGAEARLLAGILGHNACVDLFGGPSAQEAAAGMTVHGEASVLPYEIEAEGGGLRMSVRMPMAGLRFERWIELHDGAVRIRESVENLSACDRPMAWTQHVTLGPPFLENGVTQFRASATRSKVYEQAFGAGDYLKAGAEFDWPMAPLAAGEGAADLRVMNGAAVSGAFTTHLMDPRREHAFFVAWAPASRLAFGYVWRQADFPWLGIWEENRSRTHAPWNGVTVARGMEFGVSPMPESRRQMIERGKLFGAPAYRWAPAKSRVEAEYWAVARRADSIPESLAWPG